MKFNGTIIITDPMNKYCYGEFCADTGRAGVFNLEEVRKYNPKIDEWINSHKWCVTVVPNFDGEIEYVLDEGAHIVGTGNINFYTTQTGF